MAIVKNAAELFHSSYTAIVFTSVPARDCRYDSCEVKTRSVEYISYEKAQIITWFFFFFFFSTFSICVRPATLPLRAFTLPHCRFVLWAVGQLDANANICSLALMFDWYWNKGILIEAWHVVLSGTNSRLWYFTSMLRIIKEEEKLNCVPYSERPFSLKATIIS